MTRVALVRHSETRLLAPNLGVEARGVTIFPEFVRKVVDFF
jgi:hypothetical protein